ncbi:MAG: DNA mismatch repair protein MutS [Gemmatimonadota bacterium]|nr:DNA mismatch repair protein MutS [Gemmatimonadota bacterium]
MHPDPASRYRERGALHALARDASRGRADRLSSLRLLTMAVLVVAILSALQWPATRLPAWTVAAMALIAFIALVRAHRRERAEVARHERLRQVNEMGVRRVLRDWDAILPPRAADVPALPDHPYARDLDVVGHASLFTLVDTVSANPGRPTLLRWLVSPSPSAEEVRGRQAAVRELATRDDLRETLHALALDAGDLREESLARFLDWAEGDTWLHSHTAAIWTARIIPVAILGGLVLHAIGVIDVPLWLIPITLGIVMLGVYFARLRTTLDRATARATGLREHTPMFEALERERPESPMLRALHDRLAERGGACAQLRKLDNALALAEVRYSGMTHGVLQLLLLWDFHALWTLENWQRSSGAHVRDWLAALGEIESLSALATLAHDNPDWSYPELRDDGRALIESRALAHPLLPASSRVANDVTIGPPGTALLVTGSNMSGKSTLLRAIGANVVLARAGGPVCATRMTMPIADIFTSMRVEDSLERGVSLFMAELHRLKALVDAARAANGAPFLYLLDEMLHGTNTAERQVAARVILGHLLHAGALGAVTSHDLALAAEGELVKAAVPVHFSETFRVESGSTTMSFDYRLRPGLATSANALKLLDMVGLGRDSDD